MAVQRTFRVKILSGADNGLQAKIVASRGQNWRRVPLSPSDEHEIVLIDGQLTLGPRVHNTEPEHRLPAPNQKGIVCLKGDKVIGWGRQPTNRA